MNNTCSNNNIGISSDSFNNCLFTNNICFSNKEYGIDNSDSSNCTIENNTCSNNRYGIHLSSNDNCSIVNNTCSNNRYGIYLSDSSNCTITYNSILENLIHGIYLYYSIDCIIENNLVMYNDNGIYISSFSVCAIKSNTCLNNANGIFLSSYYTCTITNNTCSYNDCGIHLFSIIDCIIESNTCSSNILYGMLIDYSCNCIIHNNNISENGVGIHFREPLTNNQAHHNYVHKNIKYGINATNNNGHTIDATNNWWGAASGPFHTSKNPEGKGDNVTDHVKFDPWLKDEENWPPEAIIDAISPNHSVEGGPIRFIGHGQDYGSITRYAWRSSIDNEFYNGTDSDIEFNGLSNGTHIIFFKVRDNDRIWSDEVSAALTVNGKPRAHIDSINPNPAVEGQIATFQGHGTDDGSIAIYVWRMDGKEIYNGTNQSFTQSDLSVGNHIIFFKVQDNHGEWSDEMNVTLLVKKYIPPNRPSTVSITSPKDGDVVTGKITFKGSVSDGDRVVEIVEIIFNDGDWISIYLKNTNNWSFEWDTNNEKNGEYTIKVRSYDGTEYSEEVAIIITVDNEEEDGSWSHILGFVLVAVVVVVVVVGLLMKIEKK